MCQKVLGLVQSHSDLFWPFFVDPKARSLWIVDAIINIIILVAISMCVHREPIIRGQFVLFVKKEQIRLQSSAFLFESEIHPIDCILKKNLSTYRTIHVCTLFCREIIRFS